MTYPSLSERVDRLERQLKFWRLSVLFLCVLTVAAVTAHVSAAPDRIDALIVAAQEFQVLNANGKVVGRMNEDPGDPTGFHGGLVFMYANQQPAVHVALGVGPRIALLGEDGQSRVSMSLESNGPAIDLLDEAHRPLIAMEIREKGPRFKILDNSLTKNVWTAP